MSSTNAHRPLAPAQDPAPGDERATVPPVGLPLEGEQPRFAGHAGRAGARQTMEHLTLVALSEDHTRLLLADASGAQYTLDVDTALRSAVRGEQPRPSHLETRMDSALRPRDIQARIRSGETAEAVAAAAGSSVEKIMPYAAPVLAERAHVAERAQKSSIRRRPSEGVSTGGARTLADAVDTQLRSVNTDPESVEWDAFRREDGRWTLTGLYDTAERTGVATFTFDLPGNYVTLEDDDARWIVGDRLTTTVDADGRRLTSVPEALGDDAIELVNAATEPAPAAPVAAPAAAAPAPMAPEAITPQPAAPVAPAAPLAEERTIDLTETVNRIRGAVVPPAAAPQAPETVEATPEVAPHEPVALSPSAPQPVEEPEPTLAAAPAVEAPQALPAQEIPAPVAEAAVEPEAPAAEEKKPARKPAKRRGRASVPSWDEIMFGGGDD